MKISVFLAFLVALAQTGCVCFNASKHAAAVSIFDGQSLSGWVDQENSAGTLSGGSITNFDAFAKKLNEKFDPVSAFLADNLDATNRALLSDYCSGANTNTRAVRSALVRNLNEIISAPIFSSDRFQHS